MRKGQQEIKERYCLGLGYAAGNHLGIAVEKADQAGRKKVDGDAHKLRGGDGAENAEDDALSHPLILARPHILADKGGQRQGKAGHRQEGKAFDFGVGAASGHSRGAEFINVGLHHHVGQRNDGILQACGETVADNLAQHKGIKMNLLKGNPVLLRRMQEMDQAEDGTDSLGDDGSQSRGTHSKAKNAYKKQIQENIDQGRDHQVH